MKVYDFHSGNYLFDPVWPVTEWFNPSETVRLSGVSIGIRPDQDLWITEGAQSVKFTFTVTCGTSQVATWYKTYAFLDAKPHYVTFPVAGGQMTQGSTCKLVTGIQPPLDPPEWIRDRDGNRHVLVVWGVPPDTPGGDGPGGTDTKISDTNTTAVCAPNWEYHEDKAVLWGSAVVGNMTEAELEDAGICTRPPAEEPWKLVAQGIAAMILILAVILILMGILLD